MTENQLKYLSLQETMRHNQSTESIDRAKHEETARANLAKETETNRANVASEALGVRKQEEVERDNAHGRKIDTAQTIFKGIESTAKAADYTSKIVERGAGKKAEMAGKLLKAFLGL